MVKRYKRPSAFNAVMYSFFRKSKARRAYEHALRLRELEIDTPEPVAWSEYRRNGLITETYFVSRRSDYAPLTAATERFPTSDSLPMLEAFARFTVRLHEKGICHEDFNQTNILWRHDEATGRYHFQLIDINRMKFLRRPLRPDECMWRFYTSSTATPKRGSGIWTTRCCGARFSGFCSDAASSSRSVSGSANWP